MLYGLISTNSDVHLAIGSTVDLRQGERERERQRERERKCVCVGVCGCGCVQTPCWLTFIPFSLCMCVCTHPLLAYFHALLLTIFPQPTTLLPPLPTKIPPWSSISELYSIQKGLVQAMIMDWALCLTSQSSGGSKNIRAMMGEN